jgi:hypothetical protein
MEKIIRNTLLEYLSENKYAGFGMAVCKSMMDKYGVKEVCSVVGQLEQENLIYLQSNDNWSLPVIRIVKQI